MRFSIVATDLDGTLLRSDQTVSRRSARALASVRARGARHLAVTGRQISGCRDLLAGLGYRGMAICGQGTQVYDLDADRLLWSTTLDRAIAREVVARVTAEVDGLGVGVATAGAHGHILVAPGFFRTSSPDCEVVEPHKLWSTPIEKVFLRHRTIPTPDLAEQVARICGDVVGVTHSHTTVLEILPPGVTKGTGLARVADLLGFTPAETIAFGDMPNDIPMLAWADYGVAMGNGDRRVKELADEIAPGNDDDGVAAVLERVYALDSRSGS